MNSHGPRLLPLSNPAYANQGPSMSVETEPFINGASPPLSKELRKGPAQLEDPSRSYRTAGFTV